MSAAVSSHPLPLGAGAMTHNPGIGASHPGETAGTPSLSPVPETEPGGSDALGLSFPPGMMQREKLRALFARGYTRREAADFLGISYDAAKKADRRYGLQAPLRGNAPPKPAPRRPCPQPATTRFERNPFLTAAQQQNVNSHKERMWAASRNRRLAELPPVTSDEAARLVAEFAARRGITQCPPAAPVAEPINAGVRFR